MNAFEEYNEKYARELHLDTDDALEIMANVTMMFKKKPTPNLFPFPLDQEDSIYATTEILSRFNIYYHRVIKFMVFHYEANKFVCLSSLKSLDSLIVKLGAAYYAPAPLPSVPLLKREINRLGLKQQAIPIINNFGDSSPLGIFLMNDPIPGIPMEKATACERCHAVKQKNSWVKSHYKSFHNPDLEDYALEAVYSYPVMSQCLSVFGNSADKRYFSVKVPDHYFSFNFHRPPVRRLEREDYIKTFSFYTEDFKHYTLDSTTGIRNGANIIKNIEAIVFNIFVKQYINYKRRAPEIDLLVGDNKALKVSLTSYTGIARVSSDISKFIFGCIKMLILDELGANYQQRGHRFIRFPEAHRTVFGPHLSQIMISLLDSLVDEEFTKVDKRMFSYLKGNVVHVGANLRQVMINRLCTMLTNQKEAGNHIIEFIISAFKVRVRLNIDREVRRLPVVNANNAADGPELDIDDEVEDNPEQEDLNLYDADNLDNFFLYVDDDDDDNHDDADGGNANPQALQEVNDPPVVNRRRAQVNLMDGKRFGAVRSLLNLLDRDSDHTVLVHIASMNAMMRLTVIEHLTSHFFVGDQNPTQKALKRLELLTPEDRGCLWNILNMIHAQASERANLTRSTVRPARALLNLDGEPSILLADANINVTREDLGNMAVNLEESFLRSIGEMLDGMEPNEVLEMQHDIFANHISLVYIRELNQKTFEISEDQVEEIYRRYFQNRIDHESIFKFQEQFQQLSVRYFIYLSLRNCSVRATDATGYEVSNDGSLISSLSFDVSTKYAFLTSACEKSSRFNAHRFQQILLDDSAERMVFFTLVLSKIKRKIAAINNIHIQSGTNPAFTNFLFNNSGVTDDMFRNLVKKELCILLGSEKINFNDLRRMISGLLTFSHSESFTDFNRSMRNTTANGNSTRTTRTSYITIEGVPIAITTIQYQYSQKIFLENSTLLGLNEIRAERRGDDSDDDSLAGDADDADNANRGGLRRRRRDSLESESDNSSNSSGGSMASDDSRRGDAPGSSGSSSDGSAHRPSQPNFRKSKRKRPRVLISPESVREVRVKIEPDNVSSPVPDLTTDIDTSSQQHASSSQLARQINHDTQRIASSGVSDGKREIEVISLLSDEEE